METIIFQLIATDPKNRTLDFLMNLKREFAKQEKLQDIPSNIQLLQVYYELLKKKTITRDHHIEQLLKKRAVRSESGIVSVQVLTKPFPCPGKCIFCPNEDHMPKSYLKSEPGAMRAYLNHFDPIKQVYNRLLSLTITGHQTDKIEMIVLGGTFDVYTKAYKINFIKQLYDACNTFEEYYKNIKVSTEKKYAHAKIDKKKKIIYATTLAEALKKNESSAHRIVGLTIETRPEYVTEKNCQFWRELGVTRVEMGIQSLNDEVLQANKRGHTVQQAREACDRLRKYGFKISLHIMPGLYTSTYEKDVQTFRDLFADPFFKPDEIKLYPTSVLPNTELYELYKQGAYTPLQIKDIEQLIRQVFIEIIPPYTRIKRLIRDIPAPEIVAGSNITNLRQLMQIKLLKEKKTLPEVWRGLYQRLYGTYTLYSSLPAALKEEKKQVVGKEDIQTFIIGGKPDLHSFRNFVSLDTRSREIRNKGKKKDQKSKEQVNIVIRKYISSRGVEYFIAFEDQLGYLYGFARLLLPNKEQNIQEKIKGIGNEIAMIRELHVYGQVEALKNTDVLLNEQVHEKIQHKGFGKQLMNIAEAIAKSHNYKKVSVISGVGVRQYYRKLGYKLEGTYMVKKL